MYTCILSNAMVIQKGGPTTFNSVVKTYGISFALFKKSKLNNRVLTPSIFLSDTIEA